MTHDSSVARSDSNARPNPLDVARALLRERYPQAQLAFVAGSFNSGEATAHSDIDLIVVFPKIERPSRESFVSHGWPVEAFLHDPETIHYFIADFDAPTGVPSLANMVIQGRVVPADHPLGGELKSLAERSLGEGPAALSPTEFEDRRYAITDLVDDLRDPRDEHEARATLLLLETRLADFFFRSKRRWSGSGKHIPRRLKKLDPSLAVRWNEAFSQAHRGDRAGVIQLVEEILQPFGGWLFAEYRREAPIESRRPLPLEETVVASPAVERVSGLMPDEEQWTHSQLGSLRLRLAELADVSALRQLLNRAYKRLADLGLNYTATFQNDAATARGLFDGRVFVVERALERDVIERAGKRDGEHAVDDRDNSIIATVKMRWSNAVDDRKCLYLSRFAVDPALQGTGLGRYLLQLAERMAKRENAECLQLDTAKAATHLIEFYQTQGFEIVSTTYYEGKTYESWILQKNLSPSNSH